MAGFIGKIDAFEESTEDWSTYIERVDRYFIANDVNGDKKVPALSLTSSKTYGLLRSLTAPAKPSAKSYDEIVKTLKDHLSPKLLQVTAERFRFYKRQQNEGENTLVSYVAELRKLIEHCNFGDYLNDALRDRLVYGTGVRTPRSDFSLPLNSP